MLYINDVCCLDVFVGFGGLGLEVLFCYVVYCDFIELDK